MVASFIDAEIGVGEVSYENVEEKYRVKFYSNKGDMIVFYHNPNSNINDAIDMYRRIANELEEIAKNV